jgi:hypothetical protein
VLRIGDAVDAVLPVRFGALVEVAELEEILRLRRTRIVEALDLVRGNVQMTIRLAGSGPSRDGRSRAPQGGNDGSGRAYLEHRAQEAALILPDAVQSALRAVARFVRQERRSIQSGAVYHLIRRRDAPTYLDALADCSGMTLSGPWPPFAFTPELW